VPIWSILPKLQAVNKVAPLFASPCSWTRKRWHLHETFFLVLAYTDTSPGALTPPLHIFISPSYSSGQLHYIRFLGNEAHPHTLQNDGLTDWMTGLLRRN